MHSSFFFVSVTCILSLFSFFIYTTIFYFRGSPLRGLFSWTRSDSGPLHPGELYLGWIEPNRFGVQKRQGSFRMGRESNPDGGCHYRSVLPLGLPRLDNKNILAV
ncbi:hypothetical protein YC2023_079137 [Brassica napus]